MHSRLRILKNLLSEDGFICVQIDDNESAYLKVILDEIFGRVNYVNTFYVQVRYGNKTLAEDNDYQKVIEQIHIYSKNIKNAKANKKTEPYRVDKFEWHIEELAAGEIIELGGKKVEIFKEGTYSINKIEPNLNALKETWATGSLVRQTGSSGEFLDKYLAPRKNIDGLSTMYKVYGIGEDGLGYRYMTGPKKQDATKGKFFSGIPLKTLEDIKNGDSDKSKPIENFYDLAGNFGNCRHEGGVSFGGGKKPEALMQLILEYFSNPNDLILDSFGGSGSTAASAHKLERKWITIELGEQAYTHIQPRLKSVVNGSDQTGISTVTNWKGGGGFKFYNLAPSLLNEDKYGNWIISKEYNAQMLASAVAKQEGFKYEPDEHVYWKQGMSSEKDFIFTTTQFITAELMDKIHEEMQSGESLLIACKSYQEGCENRHANISIKKIPHMLLGRCEFGKDDYSFNIVNMPLDEDTEPWVAPEVADEVPAKKKNKSESQPGLFDNE